MNHLLRALEQALESHRAGDLNAAAGVYNQVLNCDPHNYQVLYLMGDLCVRQKCNGMAINLLLNSIAQHPLMEAYTALGCAYKFENMPDKAAEAWEKGLKMQETAELWNNLASLHSDNGRPEQALQYVARALAMEPNNPNVLWNQSLALLTMEKYDEAWKNHDQRFDPQVQQGSHRRHHNCPIWDGTPNLRLAVHGEQGVGDEIMFLSMLPDVLERCPEVVIEVEPRLMDLVERSFGIPVYGNEKAMAAHEAPFDAMTALGSLGGFFRNDLKDFPGTPYLKADPERVEFWRRQYAMQGPGPYIGIGWAGGTKETRAHHRTINPHLLKFCAKGTPVSLQYGDGAEPVAKEAGFAFYPESIGRNIDEQAAMIMACDIVVTTPQTLVHLSGALGKRTLVLTPAYASWRYGLRDRMAWYSCVELFRQDKENDWAKPLADVKREIDKLCREYKKC